MYICCPIFKTARVTKKVRGSQFSQSVLSTALSADKYPSIFPRQMEAIVYIFSIAVSSDGSVTREDDPSALATSHSRFEVVQVNALTPQDMFHNPSTVQGTPSYIIQAPAGQTYIIQQPASSLVRHTHTGELTTGSEGIESNQHDQVMIKGSYRHSTIIS